MQRVHRTHPYLQGGARVSEQKAPKRAESLEGPLHLPILKKKTNASFYKTKVFQGGVGRWGGQIGTKAIFRNRT